MRDRAVSVLLFILALGFLAPLAPAQDMGELLDSYGRMFSSDEDGDASLIDTSLLRAIIGSSPAPTPSSLFPVPTPRAPSAAPAQKLCPVCGTAFPFMPAKPGTAWGMRLDLRLTGPVTDPPSLALCPSCGFPVYDESIQEPELGRLRGFVASADFKNIDARHFPYYRLAFIREKRLVQMNAGDYDIAHAYLQAAWQAEDSGDDVAVRLYLEKALHYSLSHALSCPPNDRYYPTSRLLPVELLRRLGRFSEAASRLESFQGERSFQAAYLQRIIKAETALIEVEDGRPAPSP